ncbi:MAG: acyltransferase family protein [Clostridia bacterium]|nr:acyltransferase family protein [Clostridia bacterium]
MTISAFSMCCGYYDKILNNKLSLSEFYSKRFKKILPFFAVLVIIDIVMSPSIESVYEGFADLTLLFGFLPNNISVIGVGWFLGLIFVFYLIFPFFCVLLENKKRAWISFAVSLIYNFVCVNYFDIGRTNILYSACFFLAGGLIYLYRDDILKLNRWIALGIALFTIILYYLIGENSYMCLLVSCSLLIYAIITNGGYWKTELQSFSVISVWRYICPICSFFVWLKKLVSTDGLVMVGFSI